MQTTTTEAQINACLKFFKTGVRSKLRAALKSEYPITALQNLKRTIAFTGAGAAVVDELIRLCGDL